ncbi:hypothetical protein PC123_g29076 [Phytophthora cactorum]|nr:hypothetical protein PC123_g29076 [Phytophthora cactorum]
MPSSSSSGTADGVALGGGGLGGPESGISLVADEASAKGAGASGTVLPPVGGGTGSREPLSALGVAGGLSSGLLDIYTSNVRSMSSGGRSSLRNLEEDGEA